LLDPSARTYYAPDNGIATEVAAAPDYRFLRPKVHITFNDPQFSWFTNAETGLRLQPGEISPIGASVWYPTNANTDFPFRADAIGPLTSPAGFSILLAFENPAGEVSGPM